MNSIIAEVFSRFLGSYVKSESFSKSNVSSSIYQGNVALTNLELRNDCFDWTLTNVTCHFGMISRVDLNIPWGLTLSSKPVEIVIDGVYVVLEAKLNWSDDEMKMRRHLRKMYLLVQAELIKKSREIIAGIDNLSNSTNSSYAKNLASKIISTLEVSVKNVHVRFEEKGKAIGFTFEKFKLKTTDENFVPTTNERSVYRNFSYKTGSLNNFLIYIDTHATSILLSSTITKEEKCFLLQESIVSKSSAIREELKEILVLLPISVTIQMTFKEKHVVTIIENPNSSFNVFISHVDAKVRRKKQSKGLICLF